MLHAVLPRPVPEASASLLRLQINVVYEPAPVRPSPSTSWQSTADFKRRRIAEGRNIQRAAGFESDSYPTGEEVAFRKFVHLTRPDITISQLRDEVIERYTRIYREELHLIALKDENLCDFDPEYLVSFLFVNGSIVQAVVARHVSRLEQQSTSTPLVTERSPSPPCVPYEAIPDGPKPTAAVMNVGYAERHSVSSLSSSRENPFATISNTLPKVNAASKSKLRQVLEPAHMTPMLQPLPSVSSYRQLPSLPVAEYSDTPEAQTNTLSAPLPLSARISLPPLPSSQDDVDVDPQKLPSPAATEGSAMNDDEMSDDEMNDDEMSAAEVLGGMREVIGAVGSSFPQEPESTIVLLPPQPPQTKPIAAKAAVIKTPTTTKASPVTKRARKPRAKPVTQKAATKLATAQNRAAKPATQETATESATLKTAGREPGLESTPRAMTKPAMKSSDAKPLCTETTSPAFRLIAPKEPIVKQELFSSPQSAASTSSLRVNVPPLVTRATAKRKTTTEATSPMESTIVVEPAAQPPTPTAILPKLKITRNIVAREPRSKPPRTTTTKSLLVRAPAPAAESVAAPQPSTLSAVTRVVVRLPAPPKTVRVADKAGDKEANLTERDDALKVAARGTNNDDDAGTDSAALAGSSATGTGTSAPEDAARASLACLPQPVKTIAPKAGAGAAHALDLSMIKGHRRGGRRPGQKNRPKAMGEAGMPPSGGA
ncbi:uncharacterized protein V1518DRAFT_409222 [Limtongia smithiae]|uniref:uncharacterized protein n=1 Tax=Limtongia smithiae TaxID=1125753 RepID=UPI0034CD3B9E